MDNDISRRTFAHVAGLGALSLAIPRGATAETEEPAPASPGRTFPKGFLWGTATASYQVEGAVNEDGRGPSIWDTFSHTPGKTVNGATGDVADDHYHRYKQDIQLMKALGVKGYRFSIAWPRVFPQGSGEPNPKGLDFYNRLVDELLANGIQPFATLYHWDLPQALQDDGGGWESRNTAEAFGRYAGYVAQHLSDRVKHFFTTNEFGAFVELGYGIGIHAPGLKLPPARFNQTRHHAVLGHGLAVQAIRANAKPGIQVGIAENMAICCPVIETPEHISAAERATRELNAQYMTVIQEGRYTDAYLERTGADAPKFTPADLKVISSPLDFVGINIYTATWIRADDSKLGFAVVPNPASYPHMLSPWLTIGPEALYWGPRNVAKLWKAKTIYITENGCSSSDVPAADGKVYDTDRVMYLRNYLTQLQRATADGVPVKGYFCWSLMDNFEWADGYTNRFGLHYVDYQTQTRTPKLSADFYRETIRRNGVG
ncbi:MAG: beta-glucosidase [Gemmatimonadaceae bacterium]|nr:beta-glucosidase [Gemmatimonadaceae bacterium]NUQ93029.1 beta-glucosidase [Gemmatimonadaceae bacterium]